MWTIFFLSYFNRVQSTSLFQSMIRSKDILAAKMERTSWRCYILREEYTLNSCWCSIRCKEDMPDLKEQLFLLISISFACHHTNTKNYYQNSCPKAISFVVTMPLILLCFFTWVYQCLKQFLSWSHFTLYILLIPGAKLLPDEVLTITPTKARGQPPSIR